MAIVFSQDAYRPFEQISFEILVVFSIDCFRHGWDIRAGAKVAMNVPKKSKIPARFWQDQIAWFRLPRFWPWDQNSLLFFQIPNYMMEIANRKG